MNNGIKNGNWKGGKLTKKCVVCKEIFEVFRYRAKTAKVCSYRCRFENQKKIAGKNHPCWKGGKGIMINGYVRQNVGNDKRDYEHRHILEKHFGRKLGAHEIVHHINHNKTDNRIDNLEVLTRSEHAKKHNRWNTVNL